jgi:hypothetical protein
MTEEPDFPADPVLCFPCFILRSANGRGFVYFDLEDGGKVVPILTDEDAMDRYRHAKGLVDRGALRFENAVELFATLCAIPEVITHVTIDPSSERNANVCLPINEVRQRLLRG